MELIISGQRRRYGVREQQRSFRNPRNRGVPSRENDIFLGNQVGAVGTKFPKLDARA